MKLNYTTAVEYYKNDRLQELSKTPEGLRFLKLRSLSRKKEMLYLVEKAGIDLSSYNSKLWLGKLYDSDITIDLINESILEIYEMERSGRRANEDQLVNELYKVESFGWGGLHQNSLEKTIVDNYVKKIQSYDELNTKIENELFHSMRAYVLASWYNHWSSIIIEDIFKDHRFVLPAVGLIKKIDFFINDKPFDLKVTYLPEGFIKGVRKERGLRPEITLLKKMSREMELPFEKKAPESFLIPDLWKKIEDSPKSNAKEIISELRDIRKSILNDSIENPHILIRWLYENQGVRRFDSSNRLFLVLVDSSDHFQSWQLKRAKSLIEEEVSKHLDDLTGDLGYKIKFDWEGEEYRAESDIIFVVKN